VWEDSNPADQAQRHWERKLNGKPRAFTTRECEFDPRRFQYFLCYKISRSEAESKTFLIHPVIERFQGKTVWEGEVEVFALTGHPKASRGYAWAYDNGNGSEIVAVLELPPVISPKTAVQASIVGKIREQSRN
jgi:hypothetical protein